LGIPSKIHGRKLNSDYCFLPNRLIFLRSFVSLRKRPYLLGL
jgi:hypothetical protein